MANLRNLLIFWVIIGRQCGFVAWELDHDMALLHRAFDHLRLTAAHNEFAAKPMQDRRVPLDVFAIRLRVCAFGVVARWKPPIWRP